MTRENKLRGYDDTKYLEAMGRGIMLGEYSSVEQAARSVLGEASGSNVDRLRRKFRQEGWFVKSRDEYVRELRYGPKPHIAYEGQPKSWGYTLRGGMRFWRNPVSHSRRILTERYFDYKSTRAEFVYGLTLFLPMAGLARAITSGRGTPFDTVILCLLFALFAVVSTGLVGEAQVRRELYEETVEQ
jgi:hypothetical protein